MESVINVTGLRKAYRDHVAVKDVNLQVRRGEIFGILGPNGAGKTTTVECLQGLRHRDGGQVEVLGLDPARAPDQLRQRIGCQLQSAALPERLRVAEAIKLFARMQRRPVDLPSTLAEWQLTDVRRRPFQALSGGQQQRLFLALALLGQPELVFLDELTTGLDPAARRSTWRLVQRVRDRGTTVVLVTHAMEEAELLCDRVAVVDQGRVIACDTPDALAAAQGGPVRVTFTADGHDPRHLLELPHVEAVTAEAGRVTVTGTDGTAARVAAALAAEGITPLDYRTHYPTLEDVFLQLTGRWLEEDNGGTPQGNEPRADAPLESGSGSSTVPSKDQPVATAAGRNSPEGDAS